jgi:hypothetical protein
MPLLQTFVKDVRKCDSDDDGNGDDDDRVITLIKASKG